MISPTLPKDRFFDWTSLRSQVISVSEGRALPGKLPGVQTSPGMCSACLVRQGRILLECGDEKVTVNPGQWLLCLGKNFPSEEFSDLELLSLHLSLCWPDGTLLFNFSPNYCVLESARYPDLEIVARRFLSHTRPAGSNQENASQGNPLSVARLDYLAYLRQQRDLIDWMELITIALQENGLRLNFPGEVDSRLAAVLALLDNHPVTETFPVGEATATASLSLGQLNRMCQKSYGVTLNGYWERRRINHAIFLLQQSGGRVKEVASKLNFTQLSHFSVWFKRHTSKAPRAFCRPAQA